MPLDHSHPSPSARRRRYSRLGHSIREHLRHLTSGYPEPRHPGPVYRAELEFPWLPNEDDQIVAALRQEKAR